MLLKYNFSMSQVNRFSKIADKPALYCNAYTRKCSRNGCYSLSKPRHSYGGRYRVIAG